MFFILFFILFVIILFVIILFIIYGIIEYFHIILKPDKREIGEAPTEKKDYYLRQKVQLVLMN